MASSSAIEWTDATWNPVTGCTQVSPGCDHCYALTFAERFRGIPGHHFEQGFDLRLWPERLDLPLRWRKPRRIFVNSMSDLFHTGVPDEFVRRAFDTMLRADWHTYQILTKRPQRLARLGQSLPWPPHVWIGVSVESNAYAWRADYLRRVPAAVRFIGAEPSAVPWTNSTPGEVSDRRPGSSVHTNVARSRHRRHLPRHSRVDYEAPRHRTRQ